MTASAGKPVLRRPVLTQNLRGWLGVVFLLFALLAVNSLYLGSVTIGEAATGEKRSLA